MDSAQFARFGLRDYALNIVLSRVPRPASHNKASVRMLCVAHAEGPGEIENKRRSVFAGLEERFSGYRLGAF